jgi:hypothetical protein
VKPKQHPKVQLHNVVSSNIESLGHDPGRHELHIKFLTGGQGIYHGVDRGTFDVMMGAPSKGKFLHKMIKPKYKYTKIK